MEINFHVLQMEFEFRYTPSIFGEITGLGLSKFQQSNSFLDSFSKRLQILTWFLAWKSITLFYRLSLSFVTLHRFLAKLQALDLVNFSDETAFRTFFLNPCRYWPDVWHVSQSPWFTDQIWVSLRSIDFLALAKLRVLDLVNFSNQTVFQTFFLNASRYWPDFWHVSQSPRFTDRVRIFLPSIDFWRNYRPSTITDLVQFSDQTVFRTFFLNASRHWPVFWHGSQSSCFTNQDRVSLRSIDFWWNYWPRNLFNFRDQTLFRTFYLNACRY